LIPATDNDIDLGASGAEFKDLYIDGTANLDTVAIGAGTLDVSRIGITVPDEGNAVGLTVTQSDTTNNPVAVSIASTSTDHAVQITSGDLSGGKYSLHVDKTGYFGTSVYFGGKFAWGTLSNKASIVKINTGTEYLGIWNTDPTYSLDVTGTFQSSGNAKVGGDLNVVGDIYTTAWTDYSDTSTIVGWASYTTKEIYYKKVGNLVFVSYKLVGTSNAVSTTFTLPFTAASGGVFGALTNMSIDSGTITTSPSRASMTGTTVIFTKGYVSADNTWTNSGGKTIYGEFWYEATT